MAKKYRYLIVGLCICALLFGIFPSFAEDILSSIQIKNNPFPIFVDGKQEKIQAYNIDGYTYLKLADVGKLLDATVKFNENESKIEITRNGGGIVKTPEEIEEFAKKGQELARQQEEDANKSVNERKLKALEIRDNLKSNEINIINKDGNEYVWAENLSVLFRKQYKLDFVRDKKNNVASLSNEKGELLLDSIPLVDVYGIDCIPIEYYKENIEPLLKESE